MMERTKERPEQMTDQQDTTIYDRQNRQNDRAGIRLVGTPELVERTEGTPEQMTEQLVYQDR